MFTQYGAVATSFWRFRQYNITNPEVEKSERFKAMFDLANEVASIHSAKFTNEVF